MPHPYTAARRRTAEGVDELQQDLQVTLLVAVHVTDVLQLDSNLGCVEFSGCGRYDRQLKNSRTTIQFATASKRVTDAAGWPVAMLP